MKAIAKSKVTQLLDSLAGKARVMAPAKADDVTKFVPWGQGVELVLDQNTLLPPKDILFPQMEKMYKYHVQGASAEVIPVAEAPERQILFAIRPCDVKSIVCMDHVFLTKTFVDDFYQARRDNTIIVALGCSKQLQKTCFCTSVGIDPALAAAADIMMWDLGDEIAYEAKTEKGKGIVSAFDNLASETSKKPAVPAEFDLKVNAEGITEKLQQMFDHPMWADISRKCLGCGACTYLCPTCHCFDINAETHGEQGIKFRCWDSCMFPEYTLMAGGHNPRPSRKERVRNRFLHKLRYFQERYGELLCVGCGRCLAKCPVNLDITRVIKMAKEAEVNVG